RSLRWASNRFKQLVMRYIEPETLLMTTALQLLQNPSLADDEGADLRTTEVLSLHEYAEELQVDPDELIEFHPARLWQQRRARNFVAACGQKTRQILQAMKR